MIQPTTETTTAVDAVVIGAGPVGLWQVFQLGLQGIHAHLIDALPHPGGQPTELYANKPIYDIPGLPVCSGQELTERLLQQIRPFAPTLHLGQLVETLARQDGGRWLLTTHTGTRLLSKTVFIAAGVGAFVPKRLNLPGLSAFEGSQLFHHLNDPAALADQRVLIAGGGESAVAAATQLATALAAQTTPRPASVTLLHRRNSFQAAPALLEQMQALQRSGALGFVQGQIDSFATENDRLHSVQVLGPDGRTQTLPLDALLVLQGISPKLGPMADWPLAMERKQLAVNPETFETSAPGVFAVGDINTYPGKKKLIVCGFHEATLAAYAAQPLIAPDRPVPFQYTTSSTQLHRLLGVAGDAPPGAAMASE
ncbi:NAD(P)/FAD-dependent oxidoreductase [Ottowia sp.]|uniref:NAD(P)/FAD-dependent oxidoreductase n=1 Tax=Ottowia sp. TaxID=1898956 RepID=UPI003A88A25F